MAPTAVVRNVTKRVTVEANPIERELENLRQRVHELNGVASEHEETAEALRISEEVFRKIFEDGPIGMHLVTPTFHLLKVNAALCEMLGYTRKELLGRPLADIVHEDDRVIGRELARETMRGERSGFKIERRYVRKDGESVWTKVTATIIRDKNEEPLYGIGVVENINDQKRVDEQKQKLEEQLRHSQKMEAVGRLAGGIAHDFNNLLTVILGNAALLHDASPNDTHRINEIMKAGERAASLTRQLLTFSRKDVSKPGVLELNNVVRETGTMLRSLIGEHIVLEVSLDPTAGRVRVDASELEQVILNLVVNARDAMPQGGKLSIATNAVELPPEPRRGGRYVLLSVRDEGRGMSSETLERAYEPFFTTKPPGHGTGLGLATVYAVVTRAKGHIDVESKLGAGTTFRVYFPVTDEVSAPGTPTPALVEHGGSERILVSEDDESVRTVTSQVLRAAGYEVLEAERAAEAMALASASGRPVDLLITDVIMPDMNGRDLAEHLIREHPALRVLFISGYTSQILDDHGVRQESPELLSKPFKPADLAKRVRQLLDKGIQR